MEAEKTEGKNFAYHIVRYSPSLVRDEWVNIGVLLFDARSGEKRFRLIEQPEEFARVRRLHPQADEAILRALREELEIRFAQFLQSPPPSPEGASNENPRWQQILGKWEDTLSNVIQLAPQKGLLGEDLDMEIERLYADHVALARAGPRAGIPGSRAMMRDYCDQVFRQAQVWKQIEKSVRASPYTFSGDPMRIDYSYRQNGTRGFIQTLSVTRAPTDAKLLAYTVERIHAKASTGTEFAAVLDIPLATGNARHEFVAKTLAEQNIAPIALDHFAVWVGQLKPKLRQVNP